MLPRMWLESELSDITHVLDRRYQKMNDILLNILILQGISIRVFLYWTMQLAIVIQKKKKKPGRNGLGHGRSFVT